MTYSYTGVPVGTTEQIRYRTELIQIQDLSDTGVLVSTTGLIQIQEYPQVPQDLIKDRSTRRYYRTKSKTGVPVGTTELDQIQKYP